MVYDDENARPTMPYYQFYQQPMQMQPYYHEFYDDRSYYYQPNMNGAYFPPMNTGYMPPYLSGAQYQPYPNEAYSYSGYSNQTPLPEDVASSKVMQQFLNEDGQVDIQKMLGTVGQLADTVQQVSPVIKQLNELVRSFRS